MITFLEKEKAGKEDDQVVSFGFARDQRVPSAERVIKRALVLQALILRSHDPCYAARTAFIKQRLTN
jgi:hypothetical protein